MFHRKRKIPLLFRPYGGGGGGTFSPLYSQREIHTRMKEERENAFWLVEECGLFLVGNDRWCLKFQREESNGPQIGTFPASSFLFKRNIFIAVLAIDLNWKLAPLLTPPEVDAEAPRRGGCEGERRWRSGGRDSSGETVRLAGNPTNTRKKMEIGKF